MDNTSASFRTAPLMLARASLIFCGLTAKSTMSASATTSRLSDTTRAPGTARPNAARASSLGSLAIRDDAAINSARVISGASGNLAVYWDRDGIHRLPDVLDTGERTDSGRATQVNERGQMSVIVTLADPDLEVTLRGHLEEVGGELRIVLPDSPARRIFEITGLDDVLDVHPSRAAALERTAGA